MVDFDSAKRIVHLRVAKFAPEKGDGAYRCGALALELVDEFRGKGPEHAGDRIELTIRQSTITSYTDRPAGAWWVVQQKLEPGEQLIAFCPRDGAAAGQLREDCEVWRAEDGMLDDLRLAREAETSHLAAKALLAKARTRCPSGSYLLASLVWNQLGGASEHDAALFDELAGFAEDATCTRTLRLTLVDHLYDAASTTEDLARTKIVARTFFRMLADPHLADDHDNIATVFLPNLVGISSGLPKRRATDLLGAKDLAAARATLAAYKGHGDVAALRRWLAGR